LAEWVWVGIWLDGREVLVLGIRVGIIGATMVRGERGGDVGGVVEDIVDIEGKDAERGLRESLRRQL
jgi:hypothetical protein